MYTEFFGLNEKPFAITPDPRYLYMSERHGEGLAHLVYGVTESGGFIQLTGEVGTGKTTLVRTLLGQMPAEAEVALILNPQLSAVEFLGAICEELHIALPADRNSPKALVDALNRHLLNAHAAGRRVILLVDEAQNLAPEVLEQLRLLTNLETTRQKLLQIILIAQPELREKLSQTDLRQLAQRVTGRYHLEPLSQEDTIRYIEHRLKVAGALGEIFEPAAKRHAYRLSGGIPRLINVICDRALLGAYSQESRTVSKKLLRRAAAEVSGGSNRRRLWHRVALAAGALAIVAVPALWYASPWTPPEVAAAPPATTIADTASDPAVTIEAPADTAERPPAAVSGSVSLEEQLRAATPPANFAAGMATLAALWSIDYDPQRGVSCSQVQAQALSCLSQRGTWKVLQQLDRPVMLTLTGGDGQTYRPVLVSMHDSGASLRIGGSTATYDRNEIEDLWFGQYLLLWRPPNGVSASIQRGMRGDNVRWLRYSLTAIYGDEQAGSDTPDFFDETLEQQLKQFQRQHRLQVDGLAGQQTQIIINSMLALDGIPRLASRP